MTNSGIFGVIVLSGLTVMVYRLYFRSGVDYGVYIPKLQHFIGASRTLGQARKRAEEVIDHRTEVK